MVPLIKNKKEEGFSKLIIQIGIGVLASVFVAVNTTAYINSFSLRTDVEVLKSQYHIVGDDIKEIKQTVKDIAIQSGIRDNNIKEFNDKMDKLLKKLEVPE